MQRPGRRVFRRRLRVTGGGVQSALLRHPTHAHAAPQCLPCARHTQYILRQWVLLHVHDAGMAHGSPASVFVHREHPHDAGSHGTPSWRQRQYILRHPCLHVQRATSATVAPMAHARLLGLLGRHGSRSNLIIGGK